MQIPDCVCAFLGTLLPFHLKRRGDPVVIRCVTFNAYQSDVLFSLELCRYSLLLGSPYGDSHRCTDVCCRLRSHHTRPESPSYDHQAYTPTSMSSRAESAYANMHESLPEHQPSVQSPDIKRSPSIEAQARTPSPEVQMSPSHTKPTLKRRRQESLEASRTLTEIGKVEIKLPPETPKPTRSPASVTMVVDPKATCQEFGRCKCPYKVNPATTQHYLDLYFAHVNLTIYCMLPREVFWHWLKESSNKTAADAMVIYAMLAVGSQFSKREAREFEGSMFAEISTAGVQLNLGKFSLQLVQARLLLSLYHFSTGDSLLCWDYCGSAIRAALGMRLNLEDGIADMLKGNITVYDLNRPAFAECCRRTFWSAYLMEVSIKIPKGW